MDKPRPGAAARLQFRRFLWIAAVVAALAGGSFYILQLRPKEPSLDRALVLFGDVRKGDLTREVRGLGLLQPEEVRWLTARSAGRVERLHLLPGARVTPGTAILTLSNPELSQETEGAELQLRAAEADLASLRVRLQGQVLEMESAFARLESELRQAELERDVNEKLFAEGLVAELTVRLARLRAAEARTRHDLEERRLQFTRDSLEPQLAAQQSGVGQARARLTLLREQLAQLVVQAPGDGVLQRLSIVEGEQVQPGQNLAQVADPQRLKAVIRIPETQARDLRIGLPAMVDTRNGVIEGEVARLDPNVENGTVAVDVRLSGPLPRGARPDLTVDGRVLLERLTDVLVVTRPAAAREGASGTVFVLEEGGEFARRAAVRYGRVSVNEVEITAGLRAGDRVVISDTSTVDAAERVRLR